MRASFAAILLALVASASAQVTICIFQCATSSGNANGCPNILDSSCVCTNLKFQQGVLDCINTSCPDQLEAAKNLQKSQCAAFPTPTPTDIPTSTELPTATDTPVPTDTTDTTEPTDTTDTTEPTDTPAPTETSEPVNPARRSRVYRSVI